MSRCNFGSGRNKLVFYLSYFWTFEELWLSNFWIKQISKPSDYWLADCIRNRWRSYCWVVQCAVSLAKGVVFVWFFTHFLVDNVLLFSLSNSQQFPPPGLAQWAPLFSFLEAYSPEFWLMIGFADLYCLLPEPLMLILMTSLSGMRYCDHRWRVESWW